MSDRLHPQMTDKPFPPDPDAGYVRPHAEIHADLLAANLELSRLRSLSLTPEEAQSLLNEIPGDSVWAMDSAVEKLRLLSESEEKP